MIRCFRFRSVTKLPSAYLIRPIESDISLIPFALIRGQAVFKGHNVI